MIASIVYILFVILVAIYAGKRGRSSILWGLVALFISPLFAGIIVALMKDLSINEAVRQTQMEQEILKDRVAASEAHMNNRMDHMERRMDRMEGHETDEISDGNTPYLEDGVYEEAEDTDVAPSFCHNCGAKIVEGSKFCTNCGTKIS